MFQIASSVFLNEGQIPVRYTCDGKDYSPPLSISGVPEGAKSLVLVMEDPDAPGGSFYHWLLWNISPQITEIKENKTPSGAVVGRNDFGRFDYGGPCPPQEHHYIFQLYALDDLLAIDNQTATVDDLLYQVQQHAIAKAQIVGLFHRSANL